MFLCWLHCQSWQRFDIGFRIFPWTQEEVGEVRDLERSPIAHRREGYGSVLNGAVCCIAVEPRGPSVEPRGPSTDLVDPQQISWTLCGTSWTLNKSRGPAVEPRGPSINIVDPLWNLVDPQ